MVSEDEEGQQPESPMNHPRPATASSFCSTDLAIDLLRKNSLTFGGPQLNIQLCGPQINQPLSSQSLERSFKISTPVYLTPDTDVDVEWNCLSRSQKATRFRLKRRLQNLNLYG
jgi:hypothetical protein